MNQWDKIPPNNSFYNPDKNLLYQPPPLNKLATKGLFWLKPYRTWSFQNQCGNTQESHNLPILGPCCIPIPFTLLLITILEHYHTRIMYSYFNGSFCWGKLLAFAHVTLIHFEYSPPHYHAVCLFFCLFKFTSLHTGRVYFLSPNL